MSNSSLVDYTRLSPNYGSRTGKISKITWHHMAGRLSVETCGAVFQSRSASSNYGIGSDGRVGLYVDEGYRSWASSSRANDGVAVTIELSNSTTTTDDWPVSDVVIAKCIALTADICKRNGIEGLVYTGDSSGNLTQHCMFASTLCPGPYLKARVGYMVAEVNKLLGYTKLRRLCEGELVKKLQTLLIAAGYSVGSAGADGDFGSGTEAAVTAFQTKHGLTVDGVVGDATWAALRGAAETKEAEPVVAEPAKTLYRLSVGGRQVGAFGVWDNAVKAARAYLDAGQDVAISASK